ncbi:helix-turn-helix domain-containing protein [Mycetocola sp. JXN-3]|uniref:AraC family transcriptional regulator n=1 Tax=Mycetocola sp. JXN-3 TaxID=2116510 RepID=UPI001CAA8282|nr:helix-turn-helix transcriptional regulator [Mycetocola sp. JXN-3]
MGAASVIGLERFEMDRGQKFRTHVHRYHQLAWASSGVLMVDVEDHYWVLPPSLALWIPAGTWHAAAALQRSVMEGIYLDPAGCPLAWAQPTVVEVSPLAAQLIGYLAGDLAEDARISAETVLLQVLAPVDKATIELPLPTDPRAREVAAILLARPDDQRGLDALARQVGSSSRTLLRLFVAETGLTFTQWRVNARLQAAMAYLAAGEPVGRVADRVGYATASAFVAAFRRVTGHTPAAYFAAAGGGRREGAGIGLDEPGTADRERDFDADAAESAEAATREVSSPERAFDAA